MQGVRLYGLPPLSAATITRQPPQVGSSSLQWLAEAARLAALTQGHRARTAKDCQQGCSQEARAAAPAAWAASHAATIGTRSHSALPLPWLQASEPYCRALQTESRLRARRHSGGGRMQQTCSGRSRSCSRSEHVMRPHKGPVTAVWHCCSQHSSCLLCSQGPMHQ